MASLKEVGWSCYVQRWLVTWRENGPVKGGQFNGGGMVMLERWSVLFRENGHFTEVLTLMKGEWSC